MQTAQEQLLVAYRYLVDGVEQRAWEDLPFSGTAGGVYSIPIAYQSLDPAIAASPTDALHTIEVRTTDAAGNVGYETFNFHLDVLSPPLWYGTCEVDPVLLSYTLDGGTMDNFYQSNTTEPLLRGTLTYALNLPSSTLAPTDPHSDNDVWWRGGK